MTFAEADHHRLQYLSQRPDHFDYLAERLGSEALPVGEYLAGIRRELASKHVREVAEGYLAWARNLEANVVTHLSFNVVYEIATNGYMREASGTIACTWLPGEVDNREAVRSKPPLYGRRYITTDDLFDDPTMRPTCPECCIHLDSAHEVALYPRYANGPKKS